MLKEKTMKGLVHGALVIAGLFELRNARSAPRKILTGAMVGWHLHSAFYHFVLEHENYTVGLVKKT
jgi:hypothetical protein